MSPNRRILLADDDPLDVELFLLAMESLHLAGQVDVVNDGEAVLEHLARHPGAGAADTPALVVLDVQMPKLGGLDVLKRIRANPGLKALPVVVLTSSTEEPDLRESLALGVDEYIVKPMGLTGYLEAVARLGAQWLMGA